MYNYGLDCEIGEELYELIREFNKEINKDNKGLEDEEN